jgi:general secretion pathway protein G
MPLVARLQANLPGQGATRALGRGFSLLELMFAVIVVGILSAVAIPSYNFAMDRSRTNKAIGDMGQIQLRISQFDLAQGRLPTSLAEIGQDGLLDPWGNGYVYLDMTGLRSRGAVRKDRRLVPINSDYDLYSKGKDGQSRAPLTAPVSTDDIIRAGNGSFIGKAEDF